MVLSHTNFPLLRTDLLLPSDHPAVLRDMEMRQRRRRAMKYLGNLNQGWYDRLGFHSMSSYYKPNLVVIFEVSKD